MNETIKTIKSRRSIRKYKPDQVPENLLQEVLECARYAPSGGNSQNCHFIVVQDAAALEETHNMVRHEFSTMEYDENTYKSLRFAIEAAKKEGYKFHFGAPTIIIVANKVDYGNAMADSACALENMMLAAHSLGLGACWVNQLRWLRDNPNVKAHLHKLGVAEDETVYGTLALGYAAFSPEGEIPRKGNTVTYVR